MAKAYKCDICQKYYEESNLTYTSPFTEQVFTEKVARFVTITTAGANSWPVELCQECQDAIKKALDSRRKEVLTDGGEDNA